jgi:hypothetical protein
MSSIASIFYMKGIFFGCNCVPAQMFRAFLGVLRVILWHSPGATKSRPPRQFVDMRQDTHTPCCWVDRSPIHPSISSLTPIYMQSILHCKHFRCANTPSTPSTMTRCARQDEQRGFILLGAKKRRTDGCFRVCIPSLGKVGGMDGTFVVGRHGQRRHVDVIRPSSKGCARMIERPCIMFEAGGRGVHKLWEGSVL